MSFPGDSLLMRGGVLHDDAREKIVLFVVFESRLIDGEAQMSLVVFSIVCSSFRFAGIVFASCIVSWLQIREEKADVVERSITMPTIPTLSAVLIVK